MGLLGAFPDLSPEPDILYPGVRFAFWLEGFMVYYFRRSSFRALGFRPRL